MYNNEGSGISKNCMWCLQGAKDHNWPDEKIWFDAPNRIPIRQKKSMSKLAPISGRIIRLSRPITREQDK